MPPCCPRVAPPISQYDREMGWIPPPVICKIMVCAGAILPGVIVGGAILAAGLTVVPVAPELLVVTAITLGILTAASVYGILHRLLQSPPTSSAPQIKLREPPRLSFRPQVLKPTPTDWVEIHNKQVESQRIAIKLKAIQGVIGQLKSLKESAEALNLKINNLNTLVTHQKEGTPSDYKTSHLKLLSLRTDLALQRSLLSFSLATESGLDGVATALFENSLMGSTPELTQAVDKKNQLGKEVEAIFTECDTTLEKIANTLEEVGVQKEENSGFS